MKRYCLIALLVCTVMPVLAAAETFEGNLNLSSQAEIDAAAGYTSVTGSLVISGADVSDLGPLSGLQSVGTYIAVDNNPSLVSVVDVFPALTDLGWGIYVYYNENMVEFSGFDALVQTGDNIDFWFNDSLVSVSGFTALQTAGWSLEFGGNPLLVEIPDFSSLQTISSSLFIMDNPSLTEITGFNALQYVDWSFQVSGNSQLNSVCGFYDYFSTNSPYTGGGAFDIVDNGAGLPNPTTEQDVIDGGPCAVAALGELRSTVTSFNLVKGIEKRLNGHVDGAMTALECGMSCGGGAAANELEDFKFETERQRGRKLSNAQADHLVGEADFIIGLVTP